jgi:hypothetical protein
MTKRMLAVLLAGALWPAMTHAQIEDVQRAPESGTPEAQAGAPAQPAPQRYRDVARAARQNGDAQRRRERPDMGVRAPDDGEPRWTAQAGREERRANRRELRRVERSAGNVEVVPGAPDVTRWEAGRPRDGLDRAEPRRQRGFGAQGWGADQNGRDQAWGRDRRWQEQDRRVDGRGWGDRPPGQDRRWRDRDGDQRWGDDRRWQTDRWDDDRRREDDRRWSGGRGFDGGRAWGNDGRGRDWRWDDPRGGVDWGWSGRRDQGWGLNGRQDWNRGWRNDDRYDWNRFRQFNRGAFRLPRYAPPFGWNAGYRRFGVGVALAPSLWAQDFWIDDPWAFHLPPAAGPYRWVRYFNDVLLVDLRSGVVVDAVHDIFW